MGEADLVIVEVLPDVLGTYGDRGNALVLRRRLEWRGIRCGVHTVRFGDAVPAGADLYLLGGGEDSAQIVAADHLRLDGGLTTAVRRGATVFGFCAGLQILGHAFAGAGADGDPIPGLGLLDLTTIRARRRMVGEVVVTPRHEGLGEPISGFENHRGATVLGPGCAPLGVVAKGVGNGTGGGEGAVNGRIVGTYLHGPVLARNPELADLLLGWATGTELAPLHLEPVAALRKARLTRS